MDAVRRTILHLDLDAFFCAVEELHDPTLRGKAFAVGGSPTSRGVVSSCSYAARKFGVRSAMPMARAVRLCPGLIIVSHGGYRAASQQVMQRLQALGPQMEQISVDEAFVDISERPEEPFALAANLQRTIREELGLPCSIGVAPNKLMAKIATEVGKSGRDRPGVQPRDPDSLPGYPSRICIVAPGTEAAFLAPLPADMLWGVGPKTAERLKELGIETIGDIAAMSEPELARRFGEHGRGLWRHARGIDNREIVTEHVAKSISREETFARDVRDDAVLRKLLRDQARFVSKQLAKEGLCGTVVKIKIRWPDFTTLTRQLSLGAPTDAEETIYAMGIKLFERVWAPGRPVRLLGLGVGGLTTPQQLDLWDMRPAQRAEQDRKVQEALNKVRERLGDGAVKRARDLKRG